MPSNARRAFDAHVKDVERLLEIHNDLSGAGPGRKYGVEVLNKSGIVLITAYWEAYCEDIAAEALEHLLKHVANVERLPEELRRQIAKELKADKHELAVWQLAGTGWKDIANDRLARLTAERNWHFNTPKSTPINSLFSSALGLTDITSKWRWRGMSSTSAAKKLDAFVTLRGSIAHRGAVDSCTKSQVLDYLNHVKRLAGKTGGAVNRFCREHTGKPLYKR